MIKIKQFNFPTFEEWCEANHHCVKQIGNYEVDIVGFFDYYIFSANWFLNPHIPYYPKDEVDNIIAFKCWYNTGCNIVNTEFEKYIKSYLIEED